jgi:hypothetical protein
VVDKSNQDRDAVRNVKADCRNGGCGCESDGAAERRKGKAEGEEGTEPDGSDGGAETGVYFVEEVWLRISVLACVE